MIILKKESTKVNLKIKNSTSNLGLEKEDNWCIINISIQNKKIKITEEEEAISKYELNTLINKLNEFINNNTIEKERISFIKNYFIIYLEKSKKHKKMKIKLVHINNQKENYFLTLYDEEISKLKEKLENFQKQIEY